MSFNFQLSQFMKGPKWIFQLLCSWWCMMFIWHIHICIWRAQNICCKKTYDMFKNKKPYIMKKLKSLWYYCAGVSSKSAKTPFSCLYSPSKNVYLCTKDEPWYVNVKLFYVAMSTKRGGVNYLKTIILIKIIILFFLWETAKKILFLMAVQCRPYPPPLLMALPLRK